MFKGILDDFCFVVLLFLIILDVYILLGRM
jgi:hypothetical protein